MNILLIEDDQYDRKNVRHALLNSNLDASVKEVACGKGGLEMAVTESFDVIFLDFNLPDTNGVEVFEALNKDPSFQSAVIMMSQTSDEELAKSCIEAGVTDFQYKDEITP